MPLLSYLRLLALQPFLDFSASLSSAGLPLASLELRVAQRALRDGCSAKEVTLMLVAGSAVVRQIHDRQGKKEATAFASHIVQIASQHFDRSHQNLEKKQTLELEVE